MPKSLFDNRPKSLQLFNAIRARAFNLGKEFNQHDPPSSIRVSIDFLNCIKNEGSIFLHHNSNLDYFDKIPLLPEIPWVGGGGGFELVE